MGTGSHEQNKQKRYATMEFHESKTALRFIGRKFNQKTKEETALKPDYRFFFLIRSENHKVTTKKYRFLLEDLSKTSSPGNDSQAACII
jgi:hypothetical protein